MCSRRIFYILLTGRKIVLILLMGMEHQITNTITCLLRNLSIPVLTKGLHDTKNIANVISCYIYKEYERDNVTKIY